MISTKRSPDPGEGRRPLNQSSIAMNSTSINSPDYLDSQGRDTVDSSDSEPKISFSVVSKDHGNFRTPYFREVRVTPKSVSLTTNTPKLVDELHVSSGISDVSFIELVKK